MKVKQTGSVLTISKRLAVASHQKASWFKHAGQHRALPAPLWVFWVLTFPLTDIYST